MELTLLILAAGMGSRYGGLKQLDQLGPGGETVMDYSVFDAIRGGFDRVVFVIRRDFEDEFKRVIGSRYAGKIKVDYAFQDLNDLPGGFTPPAGREKPWGTGHAVYAARRLLTGGPFAAINADDFYGADSYAQIAGYLRTPYTGNAGINGCIASFVLSNTLSENGSVSRGICEESCGRLLKVVEHVRIFRRADGQIVSAAADGDETPLSGCEAVSMNAWGFRPEFIAELETLFSEFLRNRGNELKSEFYLPAAVDSLIHSGRAEIGMLHSRDSWFGVTYREDRPLVQAALNRLIAEGKYPHRLF